MENKQENQLPKQKIGTKVKVKISKTGYESRTKTVTVKKAFTSNLTINSVKKTSTYVTGKGQSGATVRAYVNGKQIGKSATVKNGKYSIRIPKQSKGKKITVKMTKTNYITVSKTTTVKQNIIFKYIRHLTFCEVFLSKKEKFYFLCI